jgi:DNA-binding winged helix-turn-helix (wHTH) protein/TolB-like protein
VLLDLQDGAVVRGERAVNLPPKQLEVLRVLVEAAPHLVTREELLDRVWPDRVVGDAALTQTVKELRQALGDDARAPRFIATVARRGYRLVAPVAPAAPGGAVEPRAADGSSRRAAPGGGPAVPAAPGAGTAPDSDRPGWSLPGWMAATSAILVAAVSLLVLRWPRAGPAASAAAPGAPRRSVAVLGFRDLGPGGDTAWIGAALSELLATELAAGQRLRVVPGDLVARVLRESAVTTAGAAAAVPERVRVLLAADVVVAGAYVLAGGGAEGRLRVDVRGVEAASGDEGFVVSDSSPPDGLLSLVGRLGAALRDRLGVGALDPAEETALLAAQPRSQDAARLYAEGVSRMREYSVAAARELLERAVAIEPGAPLLHAALARAWSWLGCEARETAEARRAFELSGGLGRADQLRIEAHLRERLGERARALEISRALFAFYPDDLELGLDLALALAGAGDVAAADEVLRRLRALPRPLGEDPRIDLAQAWFADGDPERRRRAADRAAARAEAIGATLLLAYARVQQGEAWRAEGDLGRAAAAVADAIRMRSAAGDRWGVCRGLAHLGAIQADRGEMAAAEATLARAAGEAREIGSLWSEAEALVDLGRVQAARGRASQARATLVRALALDEETGREWSVRRTRVELAAVDAEEGRLGAAAGAAAEIAAACAAAGHGETEAAARAVLVRAALARRDAAAAASELAAARAALGSGGPIGRRLALDLLAAEVELADGRPAEALAAASATGARARTAGLLAAELEADLVAAAAERAAGRERAAGDRRMNVRGRARAAGLERLARRAEAAS